MCPHPAAEPPSEHTISSPTSKPRPRHTNSWTQNDHVQQSGCLSCLVRNWRWLAAVAVLVFFSWSYLSCYLGIAYTYASWIMQRDISWATPPASGALALPTTAPSTDAAPPLLVPKLLHQTWKTAELPERWRAAQQSCIAAHADYTYKLWTDADAEALIAQKFPWFLDTYRGYPHAIQRVDAVRYFVLYEYGGIYLDLDIICNKSLDYLRAYGFVAPKTYPVGISNDVMVSRPRDPFAHRLITHLAGWDKWLFIKYATVMFSTGPMFVTMQYAFHSHKEQVHVLPPDVYGKYNHSGAAYMTHLHGSSWHGGDSKLVFWLEHNVAFVACMALLLVCCGTLAYVFWLWFLSLPKVQQQRRRLSSTRSLSSVSDQRGSQDGTAADYV